MKKRFVIGTLLLAMLLIVSGCTLVSQDQKNWVYDKSNRSEAYVALLDTGKTTADQDKDWIRSQNESWKLWAEKMKLGLAAPAFLVKQPATQPAGGE